MSLFHHQIVDIEFTKNQQVQEGMDELSLGSLFSKTAFFTQMLVPARVDKANDNGERIRAKGSRPK
jgi:hypothetical protein